MGLCAKRPLRDKPVSDRPPYRRPNLLWQLEQRHPGATPAYEQKAPSEWPQQRLPHIQSDERTLAYLHRLLEQVLDPFQGPSSGDMGPDHVISHPSVLEVVNEQNSKGWRKRRG